MADADPSVRNFIQSPEKGPTTSQLTGPTTTRELGIHITSPAPGAIFNSPTTPDVPITVSGTASCTDTFDPGNPDGSGITITDRTNLITNVQVDFGDGTGLHSASKDPAGATTWANWTYSGRTLKRTPLIITVRATVPSLTIGTITKTDAVSVTVPPDIQLTLINGQIPVLNPSGYQVTVTETDQGATILVDGNVSGHGAPVGPVNWNVGGGSSGVIQPPSNNPPPSDWTWSRAAIPLPFGDQRTVTFTCQNTNGTPRTVVLTVILERSYVSPDSDNLSSLSYLYDLLRFAREIPRITISGETPVAGQTPTPSDFIGEFHQPFDDLTVLANKPIGNAQVRQLRLCIEVLRGYVLPNVTPTPGYCWAAYSSLLNQIGTSYAEIRLARTYAPIPPETVARPRQALADRLGIDLGTTRLDPLDLLLLDPDAAPSQPNAITEQILEQFFGLADTTRDVLSIGAKLGDTPKQITRWNLSGVEWGKNTDPNGFIYVNLRKPSAAAFQVNLYRDTARTNLVASGQSTSAAGTITLQPQNASGLSGQFIINYTVDSSNISLAVVPRFLSWQLAHLRALWQGQDYPNTPPANLPPIIDSDLLIPSDFRNQVATDAAYNLYTTRATTVLGWFNTLKQQRQAAATPQAGLDAILQSVLKKSSADLLALDQQQQQGADITSQLDALNLARDAFGYLVRMCNLVRSTLPPLNADWNGTYSILVQVQKRGAFAAWRTAEQAAKVTLGPDYFQLSPADAVLTPNLYSTGLDANGAPLSDGAVDPHWTITATPAGPTTASAYATNNSNPVGTAWIANSSTSRWISPQASEATGDAPGSYTYHTTFDLTGFDPMTVQVTAYVAVDNALTDVKLNGQSLGLTATGFAAFTPLSIGSGSIVPNPRVNTLDFVVRNDGTTTNPSGLRVHLAITATPITVAARPWRATAQARHSWQQTLQARIDQQQAVIQALRAAVAATEQATLPLLRDTLVSATSKDPDQLTELLLIDVNGSSSQLTTRIGQAIETIQSLFVSLLNQPNQTFTSGKRWSLASDPGQSGSFSQVAQEWEWMESYSTWQAATSVFLWPQNLLQPSLRTDATQAFQDMVSRLRNEALLTPEVARAEAAQYLKDVGAQPGLPQAITEQLTEPQLLDLQKHIREVFAQYTAGTPPHYTSAPPTYLQEAYYFVPLHLALQLQRARQFEAALAWFRTIYDYSLPGTTERKIYYGLVVEGSTTTLYQRGPHWLIAALDPHSIAIRTRANAYSCYTLMSILRCLLDDADAEFASDTNESIARARTLYLTVLDLYSVLQGMLPTAPGIEANPLPPVLNQHAVVNLSKIRRGRNISGMLKQLQTSQKSQLTSAGIVSVQPTPYRYSTLIDRAKQLVTLAQQIEAAYLSALERADAEAYSILKARQDLGLAQASRTLQDLRVTEATDGVTLALDQQQKAQSQVDHYQGLINGGLSEKERDSLRLQRTELDLQGLSALLYGTATVAGIVSWETFKESGANVFSSAAQTAAAAAATAGTGAALLSTMASYERRTEEWENQKSLASQDVIIGQQQITIANDHQSVVIQEQTIAQIQADHAQATVDFLANKFTNAELHEFMSRVLAGVYSYFLQQATAMARLAQNQLGFERQERPLSVIQSDYWQAPSQAGTSSSGNGQAPDRRGLTGSALLLQDIYQLDQYAFETDKRKLQLSKTISLAQLDPFAFQRSRETGVLRFATPMQLFDQEFPGHHLRLIKRVRTSVIALIPPTQGIRATLSTTGVSRVTIGGDVFQTVVVQREPESVALSAPINATGLFELDMQSNMRLPFESTGVDTYWELQMPKAANPFDYNTLADVLITIEYTALNSLDYRQQVIRQLDRKVSADRAFSFRQQFADQWYDWHNPDQTAIPMTVRFTTVREDFPPNIENLAIQQVVLYFVRADGVPPFEVPVTHLQFTVPGSQPGTTVTIGGGATTIDGVISTRRGNAPSWIGMIGQAPFQNWELALPNTSEIKNHFSNGELDDILFVITYGGLTPPWPL